MILNKKSLVYLKKRLCEDMKSLLIFLVKWHLRITRILYKKAHNEFNALEVIMKLSKSLFIIKFYIFEHTNKNKETKHEIYDKPYLS